MKWLVPAYCLLVGVFVGPLVLNLSLENWIGASLDFFWITWWTARVVEMRYARAALELVEEARNGTIR